MVSRPTFDPNQFAVRIKTKDWSEIADNPDHPMLNRAIQAQQAPGSTFKPSVALAGLETGTIDEKFTVHCAGGAAFYGHTSALLAERRARNASLARRHRAFLRRLLLHPRQQTRDRQSRFLWGPGGLRPADRHRPAARSRRPDAFAKWKLRNYRQKWYAGETISVAIGQGALTVTPLQLARAIGGIAMGGIWYQPHLVKEKDDPGKRRELLNPDNV